MFDPCGSKAVATLPATPPASSMLVLKATPLVRKVTNPVGVPVSGGITLTVAAKEMLWPGTDGLMAELLLFVVFGTSALEIHSLKSCTAWVLTTEVASGGMWSGPRFATRWYMIELASELGLITTLLELPKASTSAPFTMPAEASGVLMRASQVACCGPAPPGWWH